MKPGRMIFLLMPLVTALAQDPPKSTLASMIDVEISKAGKQIVAVVEAMPEDKFNFTPESLNIAGADFKKVRTFAVLVKHTAASNYAIFSVITGEKFPKDYLGGDGPANLKTKAEIMDFLKSSFAVGHRAAAGLTQKNMLDLDEVTKMTSLQLAIFALTDGFDHYGQLVEYLRLSGIVPPASRK